MRLTTYIGLILGVAVVVVAVYAKGGDMRLFTNAVGLLISVGGTTAATTLSSSRETAGQAFDALKRLFFTGIRPRKEVADALLAIARQAKAGGLASLDADKLSPGDLYLHMGVQLVADGVESERIDELMRLSSDTLSDKRASAERMFKLMGTYSPMFGLVGTLIGLISMLKDLTDPRAIGQGMSVALMATFYGVLLAGLIFLPMAGKIRTLDLDERMQRDQMLTVLLAVRLGRSPEYVRETLQAFHKGTA